MYVIYQYTDCNYKNIEKLTVAPDTHVCKATLRLGLINEEEFHSSNVQLIVIERWQNLFKDTPYKPIDIHTPLWLWSRNGFKSLESDISFNDILSTCRYVYEHSLYVKINEEQVEQLVHNFDFEGSKHWLASNPFGLLDLEVNDIVNFLVIYDSIDCSFWGNPKWTVDSDMGKIDGAFALMYSLIKLRSKKGHLDFEKISYNEFTKFLKGNVDFPLLRERYDTVKQVSKVINSKMNGNFYNFIKDVRSDIELFNIIIKYFPSFQDVRVYNNKTIYFYKLAQLLISDILHIREMKEHIQVDYSNLVGCADYKIPQVLRGLNILIYNETLAAIVDNKQEIRENSIYEIEIRANMIVAINMIKKKLGDKVISIDVNDFVWSLGQQKSLKFSPYHLTRTMSY